MTYTSPFRFSLTFDHGDLRPLLRPPHGVQWGDVEMLTMSVFSVRFNNFLRIMVSYADIYVNNAPFDK